MKTTADATTFTLIVSGGRAFQDWELFEFCMDSALEGKVQEGCKIVIIHGDCHQYDPRGNELPTADQFAKRYAQLRGYDCVPYPANWRRYGKKAGMMRNVEMGAIGDALIAFWNRSSPGTGNMITLARHRKLPTFVVHCRY